MNKGRIKARPFIGVNMFLIKYFGLNKEPFNVKQWWKLFLHLKAKAKGHSKAPTYNSHPWRKQLADQPFEIDAIEQGVYEETYD